MPPKTAYKERASSVGAEQEARRKALGTAIEYIEKQFGKGSVMRLGDANSFKVSSIPTGSIGLDSALGIGGIPRGRIVEIYGPESSGKTTLALHCIAEAQKAGGDCAFIDAEHALDPEYARVLGVDIDNLLVSQPDCGEQALEICEKLVRSGALSLVVVDSVAALVPRAEIDGDMGQAMVGAHARLMSQAMRKLAGTLSHTGTCAIFINQLREKVGITYGNPEVTTGGRALKFYASVRMEVRSSAIKQGDAKIGNHTKVKVVKNKCAPPFKVAEYDIMYGEGISKLSEIVDMGESFDFIQKSGAWYSMGDVRLGQGRDSAKQYFRDNPAEADALEAKIRERLKEPANAASSGRAAKQSAIKAVEIDAEDDE